MDRLIGLNHSSGITVIRGGTLWDGTGGAPRPNGDIHIRGDRIDKILAEPGPLPAGARVMDAAGLTIIPGLIDTHVHINGDQFSDPYRRYLQPDEFTRVIRASLDAAEILAHGYTTVRHMGHGNAAATYGLRRAIREGLINGPRMLVSGWAISQTGGHGNVPTWPYEWVAERRPRSAFADGPYEIRKLVRLNFGEGADLAKLYATEGVLGSPPGKRHLPNFTVEEMAAAVDEAHSRGARAAAHATGLQGAKNAVLAGVDSIEHGPAFADDEFWELMLSRGTYYVPTLTVFRFALERSDEMGFSPEILDIVKNELENLQGTVRRARELGVKILAGSDTGSKPRPGVQARELALLVEAGLTPAEALTAATSRAAEAIGLGERIGTIESGKLADIVLLRRSPLEDITCLQDRETVAHVLQAPPV